MNIKISEATYKDIKCLAMESDRLLLKLIPASGGKIQSIYDKVKDKEYLHQAVGDKYVFSEYGARYEDSELSGFDEIFMSIDESFYPSYPWQGIVVPDHGEVWVQPWDLEFEKESVFMSVFGVRFPYKLERRLEFLRDNSFRMTYKATNLSNYDIDFMWAPHALFNCSKNTEIVLPQSVTRIMTTCTIQNRLGDPGTTHQWPLTIGTDGKEYDLSRVYSRSLKTCEKYYVDAKMSEGWCALRDSVTGDTVGLSYPVDKLPYFGIWVNEGGYKDQYNIAPEPGTGALDRLDIAKQWNKVTVLKAKSEYSWYLNMTFDTVQKVNDIDADGYIK